MTLSEDFNVFLDNLKPDKLDEMKITVGEIAKKLNNHYYGLLGDLETHMYIVGSVGRGTSIKGVSDLDIIFDLPHETFKKFDNYKTKKQSALLQEVKNVLKSRYPRTDISADGQVVVINFDKYSVELVPGFKQEDNRFKYPDTNDGGSWKYTDPIPEIEESRNFTEETSQNFKYIANMLRAWKNQQGFKMGGLLIDSLVYKFLNEQIQHKLITTDNYLTMLEELFYFLKGLNKNQSYWFALGSNQHVYNCDNGNFIEEASKVYECISDLEELSEDVNNQLREIFGKQFPKSEEEKNRTTDSFYLLRNTEQFIEEMFPVDIKYELIIDCEVTQKGFRPFKLSSILRSNQFLLPQKSLDFYIVKLDQKIINEQYDIYWKVKNEGIEAQKRDCIRGQIKQTNSQRIQEVTCFKGRHYVECYIIKDGVCVARDKVIVPISNNEYFMI